MRLEHNWLRRVIFIPKLFIMKNYIQSQLLEEEISNLEQFKVGRAFSSGPDEEDENEHEGEDEVEEEEDAEEQGEVEESVEADEAEAD